MRFYDTIFLSQTQFRIVSYRCLSLICIFWIYVFMPKCRDKYSEYFQNMRYFCHQKIHNKIVVESNTVNHY